MSSTYPAMRGKIGTSEYYVIVMPAKELTEKVKIPSEVEGWDDETIEEKWQRKINYTRVEKFIAPYLANDKSRFFGSLIVTVINPEGLVWEPVTKIAQEIPNVYRINSDNIGFLTLSGSEVMVPLDGQHRLAAMKFAITGKNEKEEVIEGLKPSMDVAKDFITVMLIKHDPVLARRIFNKVNRYARPTSKADNLITSDDDILAILAREQATNLGARIINTSSNTLSDLSGCFTTLATLYGILTTVLKDHNCSTTVLPDSHKTGLLERESQKFFTDFFGEIDLFKKCTRVIDSQGDAERIQLRKKYILLKPFVQWVAATAICEIVDRGIQNGNIIQKEACKLLNKLNWEKDNPLWQNVLLHGDKVLSGDTARKHAAKFIARHLGAKFEPDELASLDNIQRSFGATIRSPKKVLKNKIKGRSKKN